VSYNGLVKDPSRLFIYSNAPALKTMYDKKPAHLHWPLYVTKSGSAVRNAFKGISKFGIAPESTWSYEHQTGWAYSQEIRGEVLMEVYRRLPYP
jgi:hypothetical protein